MFRLIAAVIDYNRIPLVILYILFFVFLSLYASSITEKRVFVPGNFEFPFLLLRCSLDTILPDDLLKVKDYPVYMISLNDSMIGPPYGTAPRKCFDCREGGGILEQPVFW